MLHEDYSLKSPSPEKSRLFEDLAKVYENQKERYFEQESVKIIYDNILNGISTGILILRKSTDEDWEIFLMNKAFANTLQIPVFASWDNFKRNVPEFVEKLVELDFKDVQKSIEISVDNQENQTFSLKTAQINTYNYHYFILSLDSVQTIIEKKEKQAWHGLMKVISHEMMNTLTPINSLVSSLTYFSNQETWTVEDRNDYKESLETIQKKTIHMLEFVDNYRQLTNFPQPKKQMTDVADLIQSCVEIMKPLLNENQIQIETEFSQNPIIYSIDQILVERVIINLLTNSIYALEDKQLDKKIIIKTFVRNNRMSIEVQDNGKGIEKDIRDKVFIPFFTTREHGAGIGLSLSKNIMEAHDGYLTFKSKPGETIFLMSFL